MPWRGCWTTRSAPSCPLIAARTRRAVAGSLIVAGVVSVAERVTTGSRFSGTPIAIAVPRATRSMPSSNCRRTSGVSARTVSARLTSSGMMLLFTPPWIEPTLITAGCSGLIVRPTIDWSETTIWLAISTGSMPRCGKAPCVPTPRTWIVTMSELEATLVSAMSICPAASCAITWKATA